MVVHFHEPQSGAQIRVAGAAEKKYVHADILKMLEQEPIKLSAWDPMFMLEEQRASPPRRIVTKLKNAI